MAFKNNNSSNLIISSVFIEKYMPQAESAFVKVYLYGLLQSTKPDSLITNKDIANALNILESDVNNAWKYWEQCGIVSINSAFDSIEFLDIRLDLAKPSDGAVDNNIKASLTTILNRDSEFKVFLNTAEKILSKTLSSNDINNLYSFHDDLHLPFSVISTLLEFCSLINKRHMSYIEPIAVELSKRNINTSSEAEAFLEMRNADFNKIKSSLGIAGRPFAPIERKYIDKWINEYNFSIETIILACNESILNTGKTNIKYVNVILEKWYSEKIKSPDAALKAMSDFKTTNKDNLSKTNNAKNNSKVSKNKFINFTQRNSDYEQIAKNIRENEDEESRSS